MPSITYWNRLEPRPRTTDLADSLAARVRDPAWLLARQWQLGEFRGEDAASPAFIRIVAKLGDMLSWGRPGEYISDVGITEPIERHVTWEPSSPDDLTRSVELGQTFDRFLVELNATDLRPHFLDAFPIEAREEVEPRAARLRALWMGRAIDGLALWRAWVAPVPPPPPGIPPGTVPPPRGVPWSVPLARRTVANQAVVRAVVWVYDGGAPGTGDPTAWRPADLDHDLRIYGSAPEGGLVVLAATPDARGDLPWHAFDLSDESPPSSGPPDPIVAEVTRAVIPHHVRFRGMPNERFWDFEDARLDVAAIRPDRRNLASMLLADFMLVHGNDWYHVPFDQPIGTLCQAVVTVVDVFGGTTDVMRADADPGGQPAERRFSMFSTSRTDGGFADAFYLPFSVDSSVLESAPLEQVRFLRDETANLSWAIEHVVEGSLGTARRSADHAPLPQAPVPDGALHYRIQSSVPSHWFPLVPVKLPVTDHQIALERAALLSTDQGVPIVPSPHGKVLAPSSLPAGAPYRVREEEIPREGRRVTRLVRRVRGHDGSTHTWIARTRGLGTGEGTSGLRFDLARRD